jgi:phosphatidylserine decarboxylase
MAVVPVPSPLKQNATAPESIQPGGGFCMALELAWARFRRWRLRRFRPGYVRLMESKRRGNCQNCPHDVIDPRDLKFIRNRCGYWWSAEDDPFAWRDRLGLARVGLAEILVVSSVCAVASILLAWATLSVHWLFAAPLAGFLLVWFELVYFFRDPERRPMSDFQALFSPADGKITHIEEIEDPDFPSGRALRISIFLSIFDVHINRMPRQARVVDLRYFPGRFLDARNENCAGQNEQLWLDVRERHTNRLLRVKQISGAIARRIVCWAKLGEELAAGERFGMIKFGSRTDVLIPADDEFEVLALVGQHVRGGETILLRFKGDSLV